MVKSGVQAGRLPLGTNLMLGGIAGTQIRYPHNHLLARRFVLVEVTNRHRSLLFSNPFDTTMAL